MSVETVTAEPGETLEAGSIIMSRTPFDVQAFLESKKSGLARLKIQTPRGFMLVSKWIEESCSETGVKPQFILTRLQVEQGLILRKEAPSAEFSIEALPDKPPVPIPADRKIAPAAQDKAKLAAKYGEGVNVFYVRNGGPAYSTDGNWYLKVRGDKKLVLALGFGIPDEYTFPTWEMRTKLGLANQIRAACVRVAGLGVEWFQRQHRPELMTFTLYDKTRVVPADRSTYILVRYNPARENLTGHWKVQTQLGLPA